MREPPAGYNSAPKLWAIALKASKTESIDTGSGVYHTYVIEEDAQSDGGMSFKGLKWYDQATGLIVRSWRIGTEMNVHGEIAWRPKVAKMRGPVMVNARQTPQYANVREVGHDGGTFLFVRKE